MLCQERWNEVKEMYRAALPLKGSERGALLGAACGGDQELRREVELLLAADDGADAFLQSGAFRLGMRVLAAEAGGSSETGLLDGVRVLDGRYEILEELPGGGMGHVYKAHDRKHNWTVAIKALNEEAAAVEWAVNKFQEEIAALALIDHPNVVRLVDTGTLKNGAPYLVMKYVEGADLDEILAAEGRLDAARVAEIMRQAGRGVAALHKVGRIHRDLKPSNLRMADNDREFPLKVIDLGIVRVFGKKTVLEKWVGTPLYMSPEQLEWRDVIPASDVYALGLIAYQMLAGRHLFSDTEIPLEKLHRMQQDEPRIKESVWQLNVPEQAKQVIFKALAYDANQRQQADEFTQRPAAQVFGDELAHALTSTMLLSTINYLQTPSGPIARPTPHAQRWLMLSAAILLIVVGIAFWGILSRRMLKGLSDNTSSFPTPTAATPASSPELMTPRERETTRNLQPSSGQEQTNVQQHKPQPSEPADDSQQEGSRSEEQFRQFLREARKLLENGNDAEAYRRYADALNSLPKKIKGQVDYGSVNKARSSYEHEEWHKAANQFETAFQNFPRQ